MVSFAGWLVDDGLAEMGDGHTLRSSSADHACVGEVG